LIVFLIERVALEDRALDAEPQAAPGAL
jgi:hypothetical protein